MRSTAFLQLFGALVLGVALLGAGARPAAAVDVSNLSDFESDPCFQQVQQRSVARDLDVTESAMQAACERAQGDADAAWAEVAKTYRPKSYEVAAVAGAGLGALPLLGSLLGIIAVSLLFGAGTRSLLALAAAAAPGQAATGAIAAVLARIVVGSVLTVLLRVPALSLLAGIALLLMALQCVRGGAAARRLSGEDAVAPRAPGKGPAAAALGVVSADLPARAASVFALAVVARGSPLLLGLGVLASLAISFYGPSFLARPPAGASGTAGRAPLAVVAAVVGWVAASVALSDTLLTGTVRQQAPALALILPLACAVVVLWRGLARPQAVRKA